MLGKKCSASGSASVAFAIYAAPFFLYTQFRTATMLVKSSAQFGVSRVEFNLPGCFVLLLWDMLMIDPVCNSRVYCRIISSPML